MSRSRVVEPKVDRLPLSDGDYLDVQRELNAGEYVAMLTALADRKPFAKPLAYIIAWSFVGLDGQPLPYTFDMPEEERRSTIGSLDKGTLREMVAKIDEHERKQDAAREAKKKTPRAAPASSATSTSAVQ